MGLAERREREKHEVREKILAAARELFVAHGYEAVTMRKIAERIEYSPTAIYFHFKDKNALIQELCDRDFRGLASQFSTVALERDPIRRMTQIAFAYAAFARDNPNQYRLMFMTPLPPGLDPADSKIAHGNPQEDAYAFLRATLAQAIAENRMRPEHTDADLLAQACWASVHGIVSLQISKKHDTWVNWRSTEALVKHVTDTLVRGLVRTGDPALGEQ